MIPNFMRTILETGKFRHSLYAEFTSTDFVDGEWVIEAALERNDVKYIIRGKLIKITADDYNYTNVTFVKIKTGDDVVFLKFDNGRMRHPVKPCCIWIEKDASTDSFWISRLYSLDGMHFFDTYSKCLELLTDEEREDLLIERLRHDS